MIEFTPRNRSGAARNIKIIGLGGAGANALDRMALEGASPACLIAANTDAQALVASVAGEKIQLGEQATRGLGSGGDPELGLNAAEESARELRSSLEGAEAVFVLAGLGGGTGSGAAPLVAELAREAGALVIAVVTLPFGFEGKRRNAQAAEALAALQQQAHAVVCFENDRMGEAVAPKAGIQTAFLAADQTISQSVLAMAALLNRDGLIRLGFDELAAALQNGNARCLFGYGDAAGNNRGFDALAAALKNPLMDKGRMLRDCEAVLVQVCGGPDLTLDEVQLLMEEFNRHVGERTRILFGAAVDPELSGRVTVTILSSISADQPAAVVRPRPAPQPERAAPVAKPVPAPMPLPPPVEEPVEAVEFEAFAAPLEEAVEPEGQASEIVEELLPVVETPEPVAPRVEKPLGLRAATTQASLFGEEPEPEAAEPLETPQPERVAPPVPGRMLKRPFPQKAAPIQAAEPVIEAVLEPEPEPEPVAVLPEPEIEEEVTPEPQPEPPKPAPRPMTPRLERPPLKAPQMRPAELIPAAEMASVAPGTPASKAPQQEVMEFEPVTRGRFEKSEPTIVDGQDLDVPTYLRHRVKLR